MGRMLIQACICLLALAFGHTHASEVHRRAISFRPGRVDSDPVDSPSVPTYHDTPSPGQYSGLLHPGNDSPAPEYHPASSANQCLEGECAELGGEIARELMSQLVQNLAPSSSSSISTTRSVPSEGFGTQAHPPIVTAHTRTTPVPNYDVARTMTLPQKELALFDAQEQKVYSQDRMCFYANVERVYATVASASPTPTQSLSRRDLLGHGPSQATRGVAPSASSDVAHYQSALWNTWMPQHILSIYAPVPANSSMITATTTCSGLGSAGSITMEYVRARASSISHSPTPTPASTSGMVEGVANAQAKAGGSAVFGAVVALVGLVVL